MAEYAAAVASAVDSDDPSTSTITLARDSLRPIDNHRDQVSSGKRPSPEDPSPASPTEPVPPHSDL